MIYFISNADNRYREGASFKFSPYTTENGCLRVRPGGHHTMLRSWFRRKEEGSNEMITLDDAPYSNDEDHLKSKPS